MAKPATGWSAETVLGGAVTVTELCEKPPVTAFPT